MIFTKVNPNPSGKKTGDCVIRAISIAESKSWIEVYDALCALGRENHVMPNSKDIYHQYLIKNGWKKNKMPKKENGKRLKIAELSQIEKNTFIAQTSGHLVAVVNGSVMDTWDSNSKCVGNYFTK